MHICILLLWEGVYRGFYLKGLWQHVCTVVFQMWLVWFVRGTTEKGQNLLVEMNMRITQWKWRKNYNYAQIILLKTSFQMGHTQMKKFLWFHFRYCNFTIIHYCVFDSIGNCFFFLFWLLVISIDCFVRFYTLENWIEKLGW